MTVSTPHDDDPRDRPRGILSEADRQYLLDPANYSRQASYRRRDDIADRVENAIYDSWLLAQTLDDQEIGTIAERISVDGSTHPISDAEAGLLSGTPFGEDGEDRILAAPGEFHRGVVQLIELLYRIYGDDEVAFEKMLEDGVHGGVEKERGGLWSVDVDLEIESLETADMEDVIERLEAGEHNSLNDLEREIVISHLAAEDALDLDALRAAETKFDTPTRVNDTPAEFRERLPIDREIAKFRDPIRLSGWRGS